MIRVRAIWYKRPFVMQLKKSCGYNLAISNCLELFTNWKCGGVEI